MHDVASLPADDPAFVVLRDWVHHNFGIDFHRDQLDLLRYRVGALCDALGIDTIDLAARVMSGDRALSRRLAESVSTNYTYFFREPEVLEAFARTILPSVAGLPSVSRLSPPDGGELRIWSAAAASGDEAYTIAMVCREQLGELPVSILGTDLSERQVRFAEAASYPATHLDAVDPGRLLRYFEPVGAMHRVVSSLRRMCTFRRLNLTSLPWPFEQRFHVVFLRNVLYYFDPETRHRVLEACYDAVETGGWLVTSLTEPLHDVTTRWRRVDSALYRKVGL